MEYIFVVIAYVFTLVLICININKFMHIYQQSFYELPEFIPALKTTKAHRIGIYECILLVLGIGAMFNTYLLIPYMIVAIYTSYNTINKRPIAKKKFVYTTRVKITYVIIAMLLLLSIYLVAIFSNIYYIKLIFIPLALYKIIAICIMLLGDVIAKPVLKCINYGYIKEAKEIIRENKNLKVVGITGSYGKTSTKNIIADIIGDKYITVMTPKSYNTTLGVTKSIRELIKPYTEVFICEMGASKLKDIEDICNIVKPDISVITSIGPQHLTTFKSMDNIVKGKFEIITNAKENTVAVLNIDNEYINKGIDLYAKTTNIIGYSMNSKEARYTVEDISLSDKGSIFTIVDGKSKIKIETRLLGRNNIYNIACAVAVAKELGMTNEEIKKAIRKIRPIEHRLELKTMGGILALDDSFNSNPEGSKIAVETLCMFKDKYKVLVTPGMIELGEETDDLNFKFGQYASALDYVILVGEITTKKIKEGLESKDYTNYIIVNDLYEAFQKLEELKISHENLLALFENDLPDSYIK